MSVSTKNLVVAYGNKIAPQYFNDVADAFEVALGSDGALRETVNTLIAPVTEVTVPVSTATAIIASGHDCKKGVLVQAHPDNPDRVYIGATGVTPTTGVILNAGDLVFVPARYPEILFSVASSTGNKLRLLLI